MTQEKAPQNTEHRKQKSKSHPSGSSVYKATQRHGSPTNPHSDYMWETTRHKVSDMLSKV